MSLAERICIVFPKQEIEQQKKDIQRKTFVVFFCMFEMYSYNQTDIMS